METLGIVESFKNEAIGKRQDQAENGAKAEAEAAQNGVPEILENGATGTYLASKAGLRNLGDCTIAVVEKAA